MDTITVRLCYICGEPLPLFVGSKMEKHSACKVGLKCELCGRHSKDGGKHHTCQVRYLDSLARLNMQMKRYGEWSGL